ncbi:hypothetical protein F8O04_08140 [Pseudoclavibacter endophyticus]|uniref:Acetone carboxylase n=1 Tax=Pseudoclavibacter endophyticus TaxID=1778590 RepID=A0A6H9WSG4_9MICO|nr:hypothetical protein F8O04_08140 [Pseudoclavibacter endophyticus]
MRAGKPAFDEPVCSRADCTEAATHRVEWRNPRIHEAGRIKIWLACDDHLEFLSGFLRARDFPVRVHRVGDDLDEAPVR